MGVGAGREPSEELHLLSAGFCALSTLNISLTVHEYTVHALPHFTNENPKSKMMESLAQAYSAMKWPAQIYKQLLTNSTDIAWGFHVQGTRGRGPAESVALRVYSQRLYSPPLGNDSGSHPGREKGDRSPCGATGLVWTVPEATADPRVVSS